MCTRPGFGLLIAYANIIIYGIIAIAFVVLLANKKLLDEMVDEETAKDPTLDPVNFKKMLRAIMIFFVVMCLSLMTVSGLMARGITKRRHRYMAPWLIICAIAIVCVLIYDFMILFKLKRASSKFMFGICTTVLQCLIVYPIYSLYRDIRLENQ